MVEQLKSVFDHIQNVHIRTIATRRGETRKMLEFEVIGGNRVPAAFESDGVLLTLAHLWLAHRSEGPVVGLEEPEAATFPSLLSGKVGLLESLTEGRTIGRPVQVLATSHSPGLLMALGDTERLRVFEDGRVYTPPERRMSDVINTRLHWILEQ
jgi:predicted ATPase